MNTIDQCDVIQVMVDLGNLTFETKSTTSSRGGLMDESNPEDDTLEEYDEDGELLFIASCSLVFHCTTR